MIDVRLRWTSLLQCIFRCTARRGVTLHDHLLHEILIASVAFPKIYPNLKVLFVVVHRVTGKPKQRVSEVVIQLIASEVGSQERGVQRKLKQFVHGQSGCS